MWRVIGYDSTCIVQTNCVVAPFTEEEHAKLYAKGFKKDFPDATVEIVKVKEML